MRLVTLASLEDALLARVEEEVCKLAGHRWEPVLGGGRWCRTCCLYEERVARSKRRRAVSHPLA